jgi:hypothetical protein
MTKQTNPVKIVMKVTKDMVPAFCLMIPKKESALDVVTLATIYAKIKKMKIIRIIAKQMANIFSTMAGVILEFVGFPGSSLSLRTWDKSSPVSVSTTILPSLTF